MKIYARKSIRRQSPKKMIAIYLAVIFFVGLDRFLKILALASQGEQFNLLGEILKFRFRANYYIAFSLPLAGQGLAILISLIIMALIWFSLDYCRRKDYSKLAPLFLIILGASSNLLDRLRFGAVIDYLDLKYFTVFNLADAMIVIGVMLLIISVYKRVKYVE